MQSMKRQEDVEPDFECKYSIYLQKSVTRLQSAIFDSCTLWKNVFYVDWTVTTGKIVSRRYAEPEATWSFVHKTKKLSSQI